MSKSTEIKRLVDAHRPAPIAIDDADKQRKTCGGDDNDRTLADEWQRQWLKQVSRHAWRPSLQHQRDAAVGLQMRNAALQRRLGRIAI